MTNFTNITSANDWLELFVATETLFPSKFQGVLGIILCILVFAVAFIAMKSGGWDTKSCFASTMFLVLIVGLLSASIGLMTLEALLPIIIIFAISVMMLFSNKG